MHLFSRRFVTVTAVLFHVACVSANALDSGTNDTKNAPITSILKDFLTWPARVLLHDSQYDMGSTANSIMHHQQKRRLKTRRRGLQSDSDIQLAMDTSYALPASEGGNTDAATNILPSDQYSQVDDDGHNATIQTQTALPSPLTLSECLMTFTAINFDVRNFDRYPEYFRDDSVLVLPQAGRFYGAADIEEYVRFASDTSPWIQKSVTVGGKFMVHSVDPEARTCSYIVYTTLLHEMDSANAKKSSVLVNTLFKLKYSYNENYFTSVAVLLAPKFLTLVFGTLANTPQTRNKICEVSEGCKDVNVGLTRDECTEKLQSLPTFNNENYFDGNSYGCRVLHSAFAETNDKHCPHLSFEPLEDSKGKVKCQTSKNIQVSDYFDELILKDYNDWMVSPASLTQSTDGYKILSLPIEKTTTFWVVVGLVVPACVGLLTFGVLHFMEKKQDKEEEPQDRDVGLTSRKARSLYILILLMISTLVIVFVIAGAISWAVAKNHPDWNYIKRSNPMQDSYLEGGSRVTGTSPQTLLADVQFQVYVGFITWITVVSAGLGLEIFVWHHFIEGNVWDDTRAGLWKFAQFVFPLLAMTTLGLAGSHSYWVLPILVPALWKFGFPETLLHLYLGIFNNGAPWTDRACELCNGFGTLLHHSAASFVISMLVVGVFPPSRYILNPIIILVMQHWVALLKYASIPLYSAIELILEYYFEWLILSDWAQVYSLHWTAALGASVMLVAHWLYLSASGLSMLTPSLEEEGGETFGKALTYQESIRLPTRSDQTMIKNMETGNKEDEDMEESKEEEQLNGVDRVQTNRQRQTVLMGFTIPVEELVEEEALMGDTGVGRRVSQLGRGQKRRTLLGRSPIEMQNLVLSLNDDS